MSHAVIEYDDAPPSLRVDNRKLGVWVLIGSEVIFFAGLIVTYLVLHGGDKSVPNPHDVLSIPLVGVNTFVLICSSMTMVTALAKISSGDVRGVKLYLIGTAILGSLFLLGQAYEFSLLWAEGVTLSSGLFGGTFFTLTGFHGMHVFVGVTAILFLIARAFTGGLTKEKHMGVEMVGLYWHFVDLVWIIIFTVVYLI